MFWGWAPKTGGGAPFDSLERGGGLAPRRTVTRELALRSNASPECRRRESKVLTDGYLPEETPIDTEARPPSGSAISADAGHVNAQIAQTASPRSALIAHLS